MTTITAIRAVTAGKHAEEFGSEEVTICDDKLEYCPKCQQNNIPLRKITEFGITLIGNHNRRLYLRLGHMPCVYSGEVLKLIP